MVGPQEEDDKLLVFDFETDLMIETIDLIDDNDDEESSEPRVLNNVMDPQQQREGTTAPAPAPAPASTSTSTPAFVLQPTPAAVEDSTDSTKDIAKKLHHAVNVMNSAAEQLQREVLNVTRVNSVLKKARRQQMKPNEHSESNSFGNGNKKPRLIDAARTEAVKRKKMTDLMRLCSNLLRQIMQHRWAWPFLQPVDVDGLHLNDYYRVIQRPMDLGTIRSRLDTRDGTGYRHARELCEDVRLVFRNAMLYNESSSDVHKMAKALSAKFEEKWRSAIEPRLVEEEEKCVEEHQGRLLQEIAELHSREEQSAESFHQDVLKQLTQSEKKMDNFMMQVLSKCRPMNIGEKQDLYEKICRLPPSTLTRVIEIFSIKNTNIAGDEIQMDIHDMEPSTLWRLHFFVKMITSSIPDQRAEEKSNIQPITTDPTYTN